MIARVKKGSDGGEQGRAGSGRMCASSALRAGRLGFGVGTCGMREEVHRRVSGMGERGGGEGRLEGEGAADNTRTSTRPSASRCTRGHFSGLMCIAGAVAQQRHISELAIFSRTIACLSVSTA